MNTFAAFLLALALAAMLAVWAFPRAKRRLGRTGGAETAPKGEAERMCGAQEREETRIKNLKAFDAEADKMLISLATAADDLRRLLERCTQLERPARHQMASDWKARHGPVADFWVFRGVFEEYSWDFLEQDPPLELKQAVATLDEHVGGENCLHYADERLGIERHYRYVDGPDYGGCEYECSNGGWEHVDKRWERACLQIPGADRGYIYVLANESMPGVVKIGKTHRSPDARSLEISAGTGVPTRFVVAYSVITDRCGEVERAVHAQLDRVRVSPDREFFRIGVQEASRCVDAVVASQANHEGEARNEGIDP